MKTIFLATCAVVLLAGIQCAPPFPPPSTYCGLYCPRDIPKESAIVRRGVWFVMEKLGPGHQLRYLKNAEMEMTWEGLRYYLHLHMWKNGYPQSCTAVLYNGYDGFLQYDENMSNC